MSGKGRENWRAFENGNSCGNLLLTIEKTARTKTRIHTTEREKVVMPATFDDATAFEDEDLIRVVDSAQSVRDDE